MPVSNFDCIAILHPIFLKSSRKYFKYLSKNEGEIGTNLWKTLVENLWIHLWENSLMPVRSITYRRARFPQECRFQNQNPDHEFVKNLVKYILFYRFEEIFVIKSRILSFEYSSKDVASGHCISNELRYRIFRRELDKDAFRHRSLYPSERPRLHLANATKRSKRAMTLRKRFLSLGRLFLFQSNLRRVSC